MIRFLPALILASAAFAADAPTTFDVASIRPVPPDRRSESIKALPGTVNVSGARLSVIIRWAYDVLDVQVTGPEVLNERFDIIAKADGPVAEPELRKMMQALLKDRFNLELHRQTKELPALVLTVSKGGHKLKEVEKEGDPSFQTGKMNLTGKGATIRQLITFLSRELRQPVVDQTGLNGRYDYFLDIAQYITEEIRNRMGNSDGPPAEAPTIIAQAMKSQLGLQVDPKKMPFEVLVVDHIEKSPSEN